MLGYDVVTIEQQAWQVVGDEGGEIGVADCCECVVVLGGDAAAMIATHLVDVIPAYFIRALEGQLRGKIGPVE